MRFSAQDLIRIKQGEDVIRPNLQDSKIIGDGFEDKQSQKGIIAKSDEFLYNCLQDAIDMSKNNFEPKSPTLKTFLRYDKKKIDMVNLATKFNALNQDDQVSYAFSKGNIIVLGEFDVRFNTLEKSLILSRFSPITKKYSEIEISKKLLKKAKNADSIYSDVYNKSKRLIKNTDSQKNNSIALTMQK